MNVYKIVGLVGVAIAVLFAHAAAGAGWVLVLIAGLIVLWMSRREKKGRLLVAVFVSALGGPGRHCAFEATFR